MVKIVQKIKPILRNSEHQKYFALGELISAEPFAENRSRFPTLVVVMIVRENECVLLYRTADTRYLGFLKPVVSCDRIIIFCYRSSSACMLRNYIVFTFIRTVTSAYCPRNIARGFLVYRTNDSVWIRTTVGAPRPSIFGTSDVFLRTVRPNIGKYHRLTQQTLRTLHARTKHLAHIHTYTYTHTHVDLVAVRPVCTGMCIRQIIIFPSCIVLRGGHDGGDLDTGHGSRTTGLHAVNTTTRAAVRARLSAFQSKSKRAVPNRAILGRKTKSARIRLPRERGRTANLRTV